MNHSRTRGDLSLHVQGSPTYTCSFIGKGSHYTYYVHECKLAFGDEIHSLNITQCKDETPIVAEIKIEARV